MEFGIGDEGYGLGKRTRTLTLSALFSALTVVMLYIASIWPSGQVGLVAAASLFTAAAVIEAGIISGVSVYIASSILGLLLIPNRVAAILYILLFGFYPVLKSLIERIRRKLIQWVLKLAVFNTAMALIWTIMRASIAEIIYDDMSAILLLLGGNIIFVLYDYGFTKLIWFYINRVSQYRARGIWR